MLTRFLKNARGGVAPIDGFRRSYPLMGAVGMAVDYRQANAARTAFQVALDSTALMMSKDAATKTDADCRRKPQILSTPFSTGPKSPTPQ